MTNTTITCNTWLGKRAVCKEIHKGNNRLGLRVISMDWVDDNFTEVKVVNGDGRQPDFQVLEEITLTNEERDSENEVMDCLVQKHFNEN